MSSKKRMVNVKMKWKDKASVGLLDIVDIGDHKIRMYENRLAIWRKDGKPLTWDELQEVKEILWEGELAIELYPKEEDVINIKNTRHLWKLDDEINKIILGKCKHIEFKKT